MVVIYDYLVGLVVITTMGGYAMAPGVFDPMVFVACSAGTAMTSAAANTINQVSLHVYH